MSAAIRSKSWELSNSSKARRVRLNIFAGSPERPLGTGSRQSSPFFNALYCPGTKSEREEARTDLIGHGRTIECKRSRDVPIAEGVGLADQGTAQRLASGGSVGECPGRQENGAEVQEKVAPRRAGIRRTLPFTLSRCSARGDQTAGVECAPTWASTGP